MPYGGVWCLPDPDCVCGDKDCTRRGAHGLENNPVCSSLNDTVTGNHDCIARKTEGVGGMKQGEGTAEKGEGEGGVEGEGEEGVEREGEGDSNGRSGRGPIFPW